MKGWKTAMRVDPDNTHYKTDQLIRNTYRTLLTRGMRGCYVYATDPETRAFIKTMLPRGLDTANA